MHIRHTLESERGQGSLHGLTLRVKDARLGSYQHTRPHPERSSQASNGSPVIRS